MRIRCHSRISFTGYRTERVRGLSNIVMPYNTRYRKQVRCKSRHARLARPHYPVAYRASLQGHEMPDKMKIEFAESKQDRSRQTLENILEAANNLLEQADPALLTSRALAAHSGYSLGTLNKRLISVDNVFIWLIEQGQKQHIKYATEIITDFDANAPLQRLIENLIDAFFSVMKKINPKVIRFYEHRVALKHGLVEDFDRTDALVKPFLEAARRNRTNTFRDLTEAELKLVFRASLSLLERPFIYSDPIAGTPEHYRIAIENSMRMLAR